MKKNAPGFFEKASYWFDNIMSRGMIAKIVLLLALTILFVFILGLIAAVLLGDVPGRLPWSIWKTLMFTFDPGNLDGAEGSRPYIGFMLLATLYGVLFSAVLIGLVNEGIIKKMNNLAKGQGRIIESGHTLILGFNDATFVLLNELIEANRNQAKAQCVVVLDNIDKETMDDEIRERIGKSRKHRTTRIICRSGSIHDLDVLRRCSLDTCSAVIVNAGSDFETIKAILACTHILNTEHINDSAYAVAVVRNKNSVSAAKNAGCDDKEQGDRLELWSLQDTLSKIMVHTSRQPGLSKVFVELFNFDNNEIYIVDEDPSFPMLHGKTVSEINLQLADGIAIGKHSPGKGVTIAEPDSVVFEEGDSLILVEEDDNTLRVLEKPCKTRVLEAPCCAVDETTRVLILGSDPLLESVLLEFAGYLHPGSTICVASDSPSLNELVVKRVFDTLEKAGVHAQSHQIDVLDRSALYELLDSFNPNSILVLTDNEAHDAETNDEYAFELLLLLREYRSDNRVDYNIACEMNIGTNQDLAAATGQEDFIIGSHIAALLMSQISQKREMKEVFEVLLDEGGCELYMKKAMKYVPLNTPLDLFSIIDAVARCGEIWIGARWKEDKSYKDPVLNCPRFDDDGSKLKQYVFGPDDYFVVLAEDMYGEGDHA